MAQSHAKRERKAINDDTLKQKVQALPLLCVESICKFTSTAQLIRLHSNAVPLPGAFWSYGVDAALRKRSPLSLSQDLSYHRAGDPIPIFDASGARVARITNPGAFRYSALCEHVESAVLTVRANPSPESPQLHVVHGEALLSNLPNIKHLTLVAHDLHKTRRGAFFVPRGDLQPLEAHLKHLLPKLESFAVCVPRRKVKNAKLLEQTLATFIRQLPVQEMSRLDRLSLPKKAFLCAIKADTNKATFSRLSSLSIGVQSMTTAHKPAKILGLVTTCCTQLSTLMIFVCGSYQDYYAAFHALTGLKTLGIDLLDDILDFDGFNVNAAELIFSVTDLRIACKPTCPRICVTVWTSFFPNANNISLQFSHKESDDTLNLAWDFCADMAWPDRYILSWYFSVQVFACAGSRLAQFLATDNLPRAINLAEVTFDCFTHEAGLLTAIYRAMQGNSTKYLLLRGPAHPQALANLANYAELNGEQVTVNRRTNVDLCGDQLEDRGFPEISDEADIRVVGTKASGSLIGEQFTIWICHPATERSSIFDFD